MKNITNFNIEKLKAFDDHKLIVLLKDPSCGLNGFITIHRGSNSLPSFGATRYWKYKSELEALIDSLQLSKNMSYKSALAGLKYGGAKAVIIDSRRNNKKKLLKSYIGKVNSLGGTFITGADVGIDDKDLEILDSKSNFIVGKNSDPVKFTSLGLFFSIQTCLKQLFGDGNLEGKSFAIQGVGKTGTGILKLIYSFASKVYVSDLDAVRLKTVKKKYPKIRIVKPWDIYKKKVDVFSPCAMSNSITKDNVRMLRCKIIAGSANNQLENAYVGLLLQNKGVLYAPDYVVNAGGLIAVVDEYEHKNFNQERVEKRIKNIQTTLQTIFDKHRKTKKPTNLISNKMAEKIFNNST